MGIYLNPGNGSFKIAVNTEPYVDKSSLIAFTNKLILTEKALCGILFCEEIRSSQHGKADVRP